MEARVVPVLKRFDATVLKDLNPPNDRRQVPAAATMRFYLQGATVRAGILVPDSSQQPDPVPTTVSVYNPGSLKVGTLVQLDTDASKQLAVGVVDRENSTVGLINATGTAIFLDVGNRLVNLSDRPSIYKDPLGTVAHGTSIDTDSDTGRASGYMREFRFDYIVTGTGADRLFVDDEGSFVMRT